MGSSRPTDRSLGETTFLPQWMKGKLDTTRFDYTDSTFSPPADDDFFFIRYPKNQDNSNIKKEGFRPINEVLGNETKVVKATTSSDYGNRDAKNVDFSKHPLSCQQYIPFPVSEQVNEPKIIIANKPKIKQTTDDELRNAAVSECGRSIVSVANQIMSSKFGKSNSSDAQSGDESSSVPQRTVSKSLPTTPIASPGGTPDSSPKSRRRMYGNRFFAGAFVPGESNHAERKNGWLLSSILGQSREMVTPKIEEEDEQQNEPIVIPARAMSRKKSISSQNLTYLGKEDNNSNSTGVKVHSLLQPKASELREMNFWSPTSM